jgi:hypothetical protein
MLNKFKSMDKLDWALFAVQAVCWIEYLAPLVIYPLINPFASTYRMGVYVFLFIPFLFAYERMKSRLTEIKELKIRKLWATIALILVPFSIVFYLGGTVLVIDGFFQNLWGNEWIGVILFTSGFIGYCMPFVLLTYWLKYRYRKDEF